MLIYNFQKEFLGIDEKDLKALGFNDLTGLRAEVTDFSDLFVKTPGYIHNFKHVHWIDFITCAESNEESKVIINVNNKNYKSTITITTAYLIDNPSSKAYLVNLNNLRELSHKESEHISGDIVDRVSPIATQQPKQIFNTPEYDGEFNEPQEIETPTTVKKDPYETPIEVDMSETLSIDEYDMKEETSLTQDHSFDDMLDVSDLSVDIDDAFEESPVVEEVTHTHIETVHEKFDNGYTYDPSVASEELGLPLDLIEEFIQDFIEQAKEFKDELYRSLDEADLDNLKILSHKLKGVAANLRIEDALESLTIVNTSNDTDEIQANLNTLYKIIAKLSGEEITIEKEILDTPTSQNIEMIEEIAEEEVNTDDELSLAFKDETPIAIEEEDEDDLYADPLDSEVPDRIEIAELADDTFQIEPDLLDIDLNMDDESLEMLEIDDIAIEEIETPQEIETEDDATAITEEENEITDLDTQETVVEYSKESVASEIGIDIKSFNELFTDYITEAHASSSVIKGAIESFDLPTCKKEALRLKGMSENMRINNFTS